MVFVPPKWVPKLPEIPDTVSIPDFIFDEKYGRQPLKKSLPFFTCGLSGQSLTAEDAWQRVLWLAAGIQKELGWKPNEGTEWDKVAGVFTLNCIDTLVLGWAIGKLGGIDTPANAAYVEWELEHQMRDAGAKCIFTCGPLLDTTLKVAKKLGIPEKRIFLFELPKQATGGQETPKGYKTISQLVEQGKNAPQVEALKWNKGEGARRVAFLCYSSGTSGLPKGVMISHRNIIANTIQIATFESAHRAKRSDATGKWGKPQNVLGLLPFSHIYGLVLICHSSIYQGDGVIVLPKFEMGTCLSAIQDQKIAFLFIVPPILILFTKNKPTLDKYDLSSVEQIFTGAAPLGAETADDLQRQYPKWKIRQGYGLTETCTVVCSSHPDDILFGSSGSLLPGYEARIVTPDGEEVTEHGKTGELWAKSPSVVLGYLNNEKATKETFVDGYMKTGDEVMIKNSKEGNEHIIVTDRIKELIKVKGHQVAPAELESHLLTHEYVDDCTVIPIHDDDAGERPKAFVVKSAKATGKDDEVKGAIMKHVEKEKARHKWLKDVEFIDVVPKSPSGKILRRILKDQEKEKKKKQGAKL